MRAALAAVNGDHSEPSVNELSMAALAEENRKCLCAILLLISKGR